MKRPQHITITSIKYLISYPINMKVSNQVFTTSNSNKCVGGLSCLYDCGTACACKSVCMSVSRAPYSYLHQLPSSSSTTNILIPPLTLTVTFHHPEQSLLHKLHWLDHVIRVGVFSVSERARAFHTHINKSAQHFPTLKIDFYFLYTECGGLVCLFVCLARALTLTHTYLHTDPSFQVYVSKC